jgi:hypothetical protein
MPKEPKSLSDEQLDEIFEEDDFGKGIPDDDDSVPQAKGSEDDDIDPEEESPEIEEPEEEPLTLRSILAQRNVNLPDDTDEGEYLGQLLDRFSTIGQQYQQLQAERQQYQQQLAYLHAQQRQPQQAPAPTPQQKLEGLLKHWEKVPEWNENWVQDIGRDAEGKLIPLNNADPTIVQKYRERIRWEEQAQRTLFENPQQFIYESLQSQPQFKSFIQEQIAEAVRETEDKFEADRLAREIAPHVYNQDRSLTPFGQVYIATMQEAEKHGVKGSQNIHNYALRAALPYAPQAEAPKETPSEKKRSKQIQFQKSQVAKGNKSRKRTPAPRFDRDPEAITEYAIAQMRKEGIDPYARAEMR